MGDFVANGRDSVTNEPLDRTLGELTDELKQASAVFGVELAGGEVTGDGNADAPLAVSNDRDDGGWVSNGNGFDYTGTPDHVDILVSAFYANNSDIAGKQRIAPALELRKNGVTVSLSATGYQRHTGGHNDSSNQISWTDLSPGPNPSYTVHSQEGSSQSDVEPVDMGQATFKAFI